MGWNAVLFGDLEFPPGAIEAWRDLLIEEGLYEDWARSSMMGEPAEAMTVAELLAELEDHARWCAETYEGPDHQRVTIAGDRLALRAQLNEDDFRHWSGLVATMLRLGEKVGAEGEYLALADDAMAGERLVVSGGESHLEPIDLTERMMARGGPPWVFPYQAILDEISATTAAKLQRALAGTKAPAKKAPAKKAPAKKAPAKKAPAKKAPAKKASPRR